MWTCSACPVEWLLPLALSGGAPPQWFAATILGAHQCSGYTRERGHIHSVFIHKVGGWQLPNTQGKSHSLHHHTTSLITITRGLRPWKLVRVSIEESSAPVSVTARTGRELVDSQFYMWPLVPMPCRQVPWPSPYSKFQRISHTLLGRLAQPGDLLAI